MKTGKKRRNSVERRNRRRKGHNSEQTGGNVWGKNDKRTDRGNFISKGRIEIEVKGQEEEK